MSADENKSGAGFPSTHWTRVYLASDHDRDEGSKALAELLGIYRPALRGYLRHRFSVNRETADDWLSAFVERKILEQHLLKEANETKGRFRNYLLTILYRFAEDQRRGENRARRRPKGGWVPLESHHMDVANPGSNSHPNEGDRAWAKKVIDQACKRTEAHYRGRKREATWEVFLAGFYRPMRYGDKRPSDSELAGLHGFDSSRAVSNQIGLVKKRFGNALREVIRSYEVSEAGVDREIRELIAIMGRHE